jgi:RNA polymerase-interacting CarD/CdnL/TRCF family regulator
MSVSGDSHASTRTSCSSAQRELRKAVDRIADTLDGNQRDTGAYATKMAATEERAASNMGQQLQDIATVVRSLQKSAECWESQC